MLGCLLCALLICPPMSAQVIPTVTPEPTITPSLQSDSKNIQQNLPPDDLIHPGDLIDVDILGSSEYDWRGTIGNDGFLDGLEFIDEPVYGLCRSEADVAKDIVKAYSKTLRNPEVVVKILDRSHRPQAFLVGAIRNAQRFQIMRQVHLNELLILSGGITEKTSGEIQVIRSKNSSCAAIVETQPGSSAVGFVNINDKDGTAILNFKIADLLRGKKEANPLIMVGDIITVLEADPIYIIGGVSNPRQISVRQRMTVTRAIASAGGLTKDADVRNITIYRRDGRNVRTVLVDYEKAKVEPAADPILQAYDIVEVGHKGRARSKLPPVIRVAEDIERRSAELPLRIID